MQKISIVSVSQSTKIKLVDEACFKFAKNDCCTAPVWRKLDGFNY